jgi:pimeloyl-ACP methyl ester carboxylesterase
VTDLASDVEIRFPAGTGRRNRSVIGISMGGFGAVKLALRHPDVYVFAGGLSSALDVARRPFSITRIQQWRHYRSILGPWGSSTRHDKDPFVLAPSADPARGSPPVSQLRRTRRGSCRQTGVLQPCSSAGILTTNFTRFPLVMTGTSGTGGWAIVFRACWRTRALASDDRRPARTESRFSAFASPMFSGIIDRAPQPAQFSKTK